MQAQWPWSYSRESVLWGKLPTTDELAYMTTEQSLSAFQSYYVASDCSP
jgi:hypothetical protein